MNPFFPLWTIPATALALALGLVGLAPAYTIRGSLALTTCALLPLVFVAYVVWAAIIYPRFLSPIRGMPTAPVRPPDPACSLRRC